MDTKVIKLIVFDWGRTLHDPDRGVLFEGALELIETLSSLYMLALASLAKSEPLEDRRKAIKESGLEHYFAYVLVEEEDKDKMYAEIIGDSGIEPACVVVIDDRVARGIAWGNRNGAKTIWVQQGKFANELPTTETGQPTITVRDIREVADAIRTMEVL